jgi:hypothetical protein
MDEPNRNIAISKNNNKNCNKTTVTSVLEGTLALLRAMLMMVKNGRCYLPWDLTSSYQTLPSLIQFDLILFGPYDPYRPESDVNLSPHLTWMWTSDLFQPDLIWPNLTWVYSPPTGRGSWWYVSRKFPGVGFRRKASVEKLRRSLRLRWNPGLGRWWMYNRYRLDKAGDDLLQWIYRR